MRLRKRPLDLEYDTHTDHIKTTNNPIIVFLLECYYLEYYMKQIIMLKFDIIHQQIDIKRKTDILDDYKFEKLLELVYLLGIIEKNIYEDLKRFNSERNYLIHEVPFEIGENNKQLNKLIIDGMSLCDKLLEIVYSYAKRV